MKRARLVGVMAWIMALACVAMTMNAVISGLLGSGWSAADTSSAILAAFAAGVSTLGLFRKRCWGARWFLVWSGFAVLTMLFQGSRMPGASLVRLGAVALIVEVGAVWTYLRLRDRLVQ